MSGFGRRSRASWMKNWRRRWARRRTKTQASLPSEEAVLFLLFGLLRSGQITLHRLVGWQDLANNNSQAEAA